MFEGVKAGSFVEKANVFGYEGDLGGEEPIKMHVDKVKGFIIVYNRNFDDTARHPYLGAEHSTFVEAGTL